MKFYLFAILVTVLALVAVTRADQVLEDDLEGQELHKKVFVGHKPKFVPVHRPVPVVHKPLFVPVHRPVPVVHKPLVVPVHRPVPVVHAVPKKGHLLGKKHFG